MIKKVRFYSSLCVPEVRLSDEDCFQYYSGLLNMRDTRLTISPYEKVWTRYKQQLEEVRGVLHTEP